MKSSIKTQSKLANIIAVGSLLAVSCAAIGGKALATEATSARTYGPAATNGLVTYPVGYSDLDVSKIRGAKTLYLRIRYAAERVCEGATTWGKKEGQTCVNKAIDDAVARIDRPLLSQYHQLRTKGDKAGLVQLASAN